MKKEILGSLGVGSWPNSWEPSRRAASIARCLSRTLWNLSINGLGRWFGPGFGAKDQWARWSFNRPSFVVIWRYSGTHFSKTFTGSDPSVSSGKAITPTLHLQPRLSRSSICYRMSLTCFSREAILASANVATSSTSAIRFSASSTRVATACSCEVWTLMAS